MADTATALAFNKAGIRSPRDRLHEIADKALAEHPRTLDAARNYILRAVMNDASLLWTMFERWHGPAASMLITEAAERKRKKSEAGAPQNTNADKLRNSGASPFVRTASGSPQRTGGSSAGPSLSEHERARASVARVISKLDTFKLPNGRPIGDCTPEAAMAARSVMVKDARFIYILCSGLPPGRPIRDWIRPEEAEQMYARARAEAANE